MLAVKRIEKIKENLFENKSVLVAELAKEFSVTEETIRRDLKKLEKDGFLTRTYGGAFIQIGTENDVNYSLRVSAFVESKNTIAKKCLSVIQNGDSIFLDSSTTAFYIAKSIKHMRITIVTNSVLIMNELIGVDNIRLVLIGGLFNKKSMDFISKTTMDMLDMYCLDKVFISCRSLSIDGGVMDSTELLAEVRQKAAKRGREAYIIADYSKFNKNSFIKICEFEDIVGIISDYDYDVNWKKLAAKTGIKLI